MPKSAVFLAASDNTRLCKTFVQADKLIKRPYPLVRYFASYEEEYDTLEEFYERLQAHADDGHALLGGQLDRPLENESRAGHTDKSAPLHILSLDFDGVRGLTVKEALQSMGMEDVAHIVQHSASSRVVHTDELSAHVYLLLGTPLTEDVLVRWLESQNYLNATLRPHLRLTKGAHALHYPLDRTLGQATRITYIAAPSFIGMSDPYLDDERIELVDGTRKTVDLDLSLLSTEKDLRKQRDAMIAQLRADTNLPKIDTRTRKMVGYDKQKYDVTNDAGYIPLAVHSVARGFVYLDLNGGDSHAYWHPEDNAKLIYNFKGEPALLTAQVNPAYYETASKRVKEIAKENAEQRRKERRDEEAQEREIDKELAREEQQAMLSTLEGGGDEPVHFYCVDHQTGLYRVGTYTPSTRALAMQARHQRRQVADFAFQFGLPEPEQMLTCDVVFDHKSLDVYTPPAKGVLGKINLYVPSEYRLNVSASRPAACPPTVHKLVKHVLGDDEQSLTYFLNWLAYILQTGNKAQTAWLLSGTTGTGKDTLMDHVICPIIGPDQCTNRRLDQLEDKFDGDIRRMQVLWVNEASNEQVANLAKLFAKVKELVTNVRLGIRAMREEHKVIRSYLNIIVATNSYNSIPIDNNDRRWNVAPRQERPLSTVMTVGPALHNMLRNELQAFTDYLWHRQVDEDMVKVPMENKAKADLQDTNVSTPQWVSNMIKQGDFAELVNQLHLPIRDKEQWNTTLSRTPHVAEYVRVLDRIVEDIKAKRPSRLGRDDFRAIFGYCANGAWASQTPTKFTRAVRKYDNWDFNTRSGRRMTMPDGTVVVGYEIQFTATAEECARYIEYYSRTEV